MKAFQRVNNINVLVDLVVVGNRRARENAMTVLLNLVKSSGDKTVREFREVDGVEVTVRALVSDNSEVSARGKSKIEVLLRVLESKQGSQL
ncbi:unnamed protein product [Musa textilis]